MSDCSTSRRMIKPSITIKQGIIQINRVDLDCINRDMYRLFAHMGSKWCKRGGTLFSDEGITFYFESQDGSCYLNECDPKCESEITLQGFDFADWHIIEEGGGRYEWDAILIRRKRIRLFKTVISKRGPRFKKKLKCRR